MVGDFNPVFSQNDSESTKNKQTKLYTQREYLNNINIFLGDISVLQIYLLKIYKYLSWRYIYIYSHAKHRKISNPVCPRASTSFIYKFKHISKFMSKEEIKIEI